MGSLDAGYRLRPYWRGLKKSKNGASSRKRKPKSKPRRTSAASGGLGAGRVVVFVRAMHRECIETELMRLD